MIAYAANAEHNIQRHLETFSETFSELQQEGLTEHQSVPYAVRWEPLSDEGIIEAGDPDFDAMQIVDIPLILFNALHMIRVATQ